MLVLAAALLAGAGGLRPALALTLEEAVQRAVDTNPDVGAAAGDRRAADEQVRQAKSAYLPQADTRIAIGREWANTPGTRASSPPAEDDSTVKNRTDASLTVRQMLFDGFATDSDVERRQMLTESAASRVLQSAEQIGIDTIESYIETLRATDTVAINRENVRTHESYVAALQKRLDRGAGDVGDLRRAQSRLASARGQLLDAEGRLKDTQARFQRAVGMPPANLERPLAPEQSLPPDVEAGVELALRNNPLVQRAEAEVEAARAQIRQSKSAFFPQFDFELNGNTGDNLQGVKGRDSTANALLVMRYNLSRGGGDLARTQESVERMAAANQRLGAARRDTERDMRLAWSALRTARARAIAANEQVLSDARGRDAFRRQFDLGRSRILDLLDSERDYYNSLQLRTAQEATALFGIYRVLQSGGVLLRTLTVKAPDEAFGSPTTPWAAQVALTRQEKPYAPPPGTASPAPIPPDLQLRPPPELGRDLVPPLSPEAPSIIPVMPPGSQAPVGVIPGSQPAPRTAPSSTPMPSRQSSLLPPELPPVPPVARLTPLDTAHLPPEDRALSDQLSSDRLPPAPETRPLTVLAPGAGAPLVTAPPAVTATPAVTAAPLPPIATPRELSTSGAPVPATRAAPKSRAPRAWPNGVAPPPIGDDG